MPELKKLTETACKAAPPGVKLWDTEIKGFALFAGKTKKTFYYQRDVKGKTTRERLGNWPDISAGVARGAAIELAAEHVTGVAAKRMQAKSIPTLEQAMETYLARPKLRSEHNKRVLKGQLTNHLTRWLHLPLNEITREMCVNAHARITKNGTRAANHTLKSFRSVYNHALRTHEMPVCPTIAIEWHEEQPPKKIIDDLEKWKSEVDALPNHIHSAYYRLLLLTGLRRDEARSLRWDQIHDDHLHLPMTKNGRSFDLPLLDVHHEILAPMRVYRSDYVFHGKRQALHMKEPARISWSPHDHRRTFATVAEHDAGLHEVTVGHLLNHTPTSVTGRRYVAVGHESLRKPMEAVVFAFKRKDLI